MAQVTAEKVIDEGAASVNSQQPSRSLLRSVTLIASCTGAMIVNVRLFPLTSG